MQCALLMCQIGLCIRLRVQQNHAVALLLRQVSPHFPYITYRDQTIGGGREGEYNRRFLIDCPAFVSNDSTSFLSLVSSLNMMKTRTLSVPAGLFCCFHNPPNSDMDYRIFNVRM